MLRPVAVVGPQYLLSSESEAHDDFHLRVVAVKGPMPAVKLAARLERPGTLLAYALLSDATVPHRRSARQVSECRKARTAAYT